MKLVCFFSQQCLLLAVLFHFGSCEKLFDQCQTTVEQDTNTLLISNCSQSRSSLVLITNPLTGRLDIDPIFVDPDTRTVKQRTIKFRNNTGLKFINWNKFLFGNKESASLKLKEVIFEEDCGRLQLDINAQQGAVYIEKVSIMSPNGVKSVNLYRSQGIRELAIHGSFVNGSSYVGKFLYGLNPTLNVRRLTLLGDLDKKFFVASFLRDILEKGIQKSSLSGLKISNLNLEEVPLDLSYILKGASLLKSLVIDNCKMNTAIDSKFLRNILGKSYTTECESSGSLPMDELTLNFTNAEKISIKQGALGHICPQSKMINGDAVSSEMIAAWGRNGSRRCLIMPSGINENIGDEVCKWCILNSRDGKADIPENSIGCLDHMSGRNKATNAKKQLHNNDFLKLVLLFVSVKLI